MWQHRAEGHTRVNAHRGAMSYAPQNTFASFEKAVELGADIVELDVHLSADGEVVVIHDPTLSHTTDGDGLVKDKTLAELKQLDAGSSFGSEFAGQRIPTLDEVLAWARGQCVLDIEIKGSPWPYPGIEQKVVDLIRRHEMTDQVIIISFDHRRVAAVKAIAPEIAAGTLFGGCPVDLVAVGQMAGANAILPPWQYVDAETVERAHAAGLSVHPWETRDPAEIDRLIRLGVDSICSNQPDLVVRAIAKAGR